MFKKEDYENTVLQTKYDDADWDSDDDDEDETLSFYEFLINSESNNSSMKSSEQEEVEDDDYFEFFSEEMKKSTQQENIIFCGKVIPHRQPEVSEIKEPNKNGIKEKKQRRQGGLLSWRWSFMNSSHKSKKNYDEKAKVKQPCMKQNSSNSKRSKFQGFSVLRMSAMFATVVKSRWYLNLFGISSFRSKMELTDIKNRQSRRSPSFPLFRLDGSDDYHKKRERGTGAWVLLRALSCNGSHHHQANAVVLAYRSSDSKCVN